MGKRKITVEKTDALVVIDMQKDFLLKTGALYVKGIFAEPDTEELIRRIKKLSKLPFSLLMASRDMHPDNHIEFNAFGPHCVSGTKGADYHSKIKGVLSRGNTIHVRKGGRSDIVSLSIASSDNFPNEVNYLRRRNIKRIFLTGVAYNFCVGESAIDFARQGVEVYVVRDAVRSVPMPDEAFGSPENMDQKLKAYGVKLTFFKDIG